MRALGVGLLLTILAVALTVLAAGCGGPKQEGNAPDGSSEPVPSSQPAAGGAATIELVGADGTSKAIKLADLPAVTGKGGFKKSTGTMVGPNTFKGAKVADILAQIGGLGKDQGLQVVAKDGYSINYSAGQLEGQVLTYDPKGTALHVGGVTAILAYECDGQTSFEGCPRLVYVADEPAFTDGHYWVKDVATLKVVAGIADWSVRMVGRGEVVIDRATFESLATCPDTPHPATKVEVEGKDGSKSIYQGVPLWVLISTVDGGDPPSGHYMFNRELAKQGYKIKVVSKDGYEVELDSKLVADNKDILVAYLKDGQPLPEDEAPLKLVGSGLSNKKQMVKQIAEIRLEGVQ
ncbi:MAG TPA: hypothetical protein GX513_00985 [Firmicutes bacterium]|nr:hypothetical protein [Bacillota bacterium]